MTITQMFTSITLRSRLDPADLAHLLPQLLAQALLILVTGIGETLVPQSPTKTVAWLQVVLIALGPGARLLGLKVLMLSAAAEVDLSKNSSNEQ